MLAQTLGRDATPEEIGKHLNLTPSKIAIVRKALSATAPMGRSGDTENSLDLDDLLVGVPSHEETTELDDYDREALRAAIDLGLTERERQVIELRYGMGTGDAPQSVQTLEQIGERIGLITRERVRQIENHALRKLQVFIQQKREQAEKNRQARKKKMKK